MECVREMIAAGTCVGALSGCATDSHYYVWDFEQAPPENPPTQMIGNVQTQTEYAYSGQTALKMESPGEGFELHALLIQLQPESPLTQQHYGRAMVRVSSDGAMGGDFTLIQAVGPAKARSGAPPGTKVMTRVRVDGRDDHLFTNYDTWHDNGQGQSDWLTDCWNQTEPEDAAPSQYLVPHNQWVCVQWHFDARENRSRMWLAGEPLEQVNTTLVGDGCIAPNTQMGQWIAFPCKPYSPLTLAVFLSEACLQAHLLGLPQLATFDPTKDTLTQ